MNFTGTQNSNLESAKVIRDVCQISRLAKIRESFTQALKAVETRYPDWLRRVSPAHWHERYNSPPRNLSLKADKLEMHALVHKIGADGLYLLEAVSRSGVPGLAELPEILKLRRTWQEQYEQFEGKVLWRNEACLGCSASSMLPQSLINSNHNVHT
jgi:hypothetical protein